MIVHVEEYHHLMCDIINDRNLLSWRYVMPSSSGSKSKHSKQQADTMKPDAETCEGNPHNKKSDGNTRIYYRTSQQLALGKHDRPTRNVMGMYVYVCI
jgi:hypothetical protein